MNLGMSARQIVSVVGEAAIGSVIFWGPDIALHAARGGRFSGIDVILLTIALPAFSGSCLVWIWKRGIAFKTRACRVILPIIGIWLFGPLMLMISATTGRGGFAKSGIWHSLGEMTLMFPVSTFIGSTYDGTLFAVFLATLCLPLLGISIRTIPNRPDSRLASPT
jgi:hypothetical protein